MKKFLMFVILMFVVSVANAFQTQTIVNPRSGQDAAYTPAVNGSGGYLYNGDVVCWSSISRSTITAVTLSTTEGADNVAGVWIVQSGTKTPNGSVGLVQIFGYNGSIKVKMTMGTNIAEYGGIGLSTTSAHCSAVIANGSAFGFSFDAVSATTTTTIKGFIKALGTQ